MFCDADEPIIHGILNYMDRNALPKDTPIHEYESCVRCGRLGHATADCDYPLPAASEMEQRIRARTAQAISLAPAEWMPDEFGLHFPNPQSVSPVSNFSNEAFCFNCGRTGHLLPDCDQPSFDRLLEQFGDLRDRTNRILARRTDVAMGVAKKFRHSPL
jgi:hypothetical protein